MMNTTPNPCPRSRGFALVATLALMILLSVLAIGMLSLSSVSLRNSSRGDSMSDAKANARLALMVAIGELQKEMGPDMRVSAESAILDTNEQTEAIDGLAQSRWLASYNSWGGWLNADYAPPGSSNLKIQDTYGKDHLQLTVIKGYLAKLLGNARVMHYLMQNRPEFRPEFQAITQMTSTLPVETA